MCYTGLFRRIIPFVLTFAVGLFIASFFVPIGLPNANWRGGRGMNKFHEMQQLRIENDDLREKNRALQLQIDELKSRTDNWDSDLDNVGELPLVDLDEHKPPPPPPRRPKHPGFE
ncbi:MAG: hypothetical protein ABI646_00575 [Acidobacteriota bacterium]